jgi:hypothetical protein
MIHLFQYSKRKLKVPDPVKINGRKIRLPDNNKNLNSCRPRAFTWRMNGSLSGSLFFVCSSCFSGSILFPWLLPGEWIRHADKARFRCPRAT